MFVWMLGWPRKIWKNKHESGSCYPQEMEPRGRGGMSCSSSSVVPLYCLLFVSYKYIICKTKWVHSAGLLPKHSIHVWSVPEGFRGVCSWLLPPWTWLRPRGCRWACHAGEQKPLPRPQVCALHPPFTLPALGPLCRVAAAAATQDRSLMGLGSSFPALWGSLLGAGWERDMMDASSATSPGGRIANFTAYWLKALLQYGGRDTGICWLSQGHRDCHRSACDALSCLPRVGATPSLHLTLS